MHVDHIKVREVLVLDKSDVRMTPDGYLTATPRVGRTGIQLYRGSELGRPEMDVVRVWRPETEVMHKDAMASLAFKPITNDHPREAVTADNWKKFSVGNMGGEIARDGEFIRVPLVLMDGNTIRDVNEGKKELSLGYTSNIEWRKGVTDKGEEYDAVQTTIRVNHLAVVDAARGGPKLAIGDSVSLSDVSLVMARKAIESGVYMKDGVLSEDADRLLYLDNANKYPFGQNGKVYRSALMSIKAEAGTSEHSTIVAAADELLKLIDAKMEKSRMTTETVFRTEVIDGISIQLSDIAASVVLRRVKGLEAEAGDLRTKLEAAEKRQKDAAFEKEEEEKKSKKKQEEDAATIAALTQKLKDSELTPEKLDKLVADRAVVVGKAKVILGDKLVVTGKTEAEIKKQVVDSKLGDAAKTFSADAIDAAFAVYTNDVKPEQIKAADAAAHMFSGTPSPASLNDSEVRYQNYNKKIEDAWKTPNKAA